MVVVIEKNYLKLKKVSIQNMYICMFRRMLLKSYCNCYNIITTTVFSDCD